MTRVGVLFVCMGNICRSPLAEGIFLHKVNRRGAADRFLVDSAGTGSWHVGEPPDPRVVEVAEGYGVTLAGTARQVSRADVRRFDHLIAMDEHNRLELERLGAPAGNVRLLLACDPSATSRDVPDPYYGGRRGFETIYTLIDSACDALLDELLAIDP